MLRSEFQTFADLLPEAMLLVSGDGRILAANQRLEDLLDWHTQHATDPRLADLVTDPPETVSQYLRECAQSHSFVRGSLSVRTTKGNLRPFRCEGLVVQARSDIDEPIVLLRLTRKQGKGGQRRPRDQERTSLGIGDAVIVTDEVGKVTLISNAAELLTGWKQVEAVGRSFAEIVKIINGKTRQLVDETVAVAIQTDGAVRIHNQAVLVSRDGTERHIEGCGAPIRDVEHHLQGLVFVVRDATDRWRNEERFRLALEAAEVGVWEWNLDTNDVQWSGMVERLHGLAPGSFAGTFDGYAQLVHPDDRAIFVQSATIAAHDRTDYDGEVRIVWPDSSVHWMAARGRVTFNPDPQSARMVGIVQDITARRQAQEAQRELTAERDRVLRQLQLQIERMPLAYILIDPDARVVDWNPAAEKTFGYSKEEAIGRECLGLIVPPALHEQMREIVQRIRTGDMNAHSVNENRTKNGRAITCEWFNTPLLSDDGRVIGVFCLARDVTEQKLLEEKLRQSQKMEAVGRLAGGIAHDFNNLLTVISGYGAMLLDNLPRGAPTYQFAEEICKAGDRAASLTNQLLAFSRRQILQPVTLNLNAVVHDMHMMLGRLIGDDIELKLDLAAGPDQVFADPGQIEQVIVNLVVNSRDAMLEGGTLTLETRNVKIDEAQASAQPEATPGAYVMLVVSDTGHGMPPELVARVFDPFFTTKEIGKGTGLGLAIVHGIIEQTGGHIQVYSEVDHGTTFKIYLPRFAEAAALNDQVSRTSRVLYGHETVLLVEDDDRVRTFVCAALESYGYRVLTAQSGKQAIAIAQELKESLHLLVTDVVMPQMSGVQLVEELKPVTPNIKALYLSGYTNDAVIRRGMRPETTAFLQKPFTAAVLAGKIRELLERSPDDAG